MKPMHIAMALLSAAMFFVLAGVFMGVQLELDGTKLVVDTASDIRWQWVFIGTAVVFFFQLLRPAFQKGLKSVSGPKFILPAIDGSTVKQKLFLMALLVVLSLFVINRLLRMPLGRAWEALREDEIACRSLGLSPRRIKLTAFTISAAFAGFAGTLFAARQGFVSPESFTFAESAFVLAIVVLGGMGSQFAVILAAILLVVSRELMRDFNEYSMLMLGGLMVLMMIWRPQGLLPMTRPQLKLKNGAAKGEQA
ncbi:ABC transporter permease subunit [Escherichia coli]